MLRRPRSNSLVAVAVLAVSALGAATPYATAASAPLRSVPGVTPTWINHATDLGASKTSDRLTVHVYLSSQNPAALAAYATAVSDPRDPEYHHYLSASRMLRRFGPAPGQAAAVRSWLSRSGMSVTTRGAGEILASGTVAAADTAFGTRLHDYLLSGHRERAPRAAPRMPASLSSAILGISGLDSTQPQVEADSLDVAAGSSDDTTCSGYFGQRTATNLPSAYGGAPPWSVCGYTGQQLRSAYGLTAANLDGAGSTVAIVNAGAVPDMATDANTIAEQQGAQPFRPGQYGEDLVCAADNSCDTAVHSNQEEILDVEAVHAMAPAADIRYVGTSTVSANAETSLLDGLTDIVDRHLADIVSDSWYLKGTDETIPSDVVSEYEQVFEQGAVEGIGFYFGTGDGGDQSYAASDGQPSVNFPAADPWATAVGGTSLAINARDGYSWETGWGDDEASLTADGSGWNQPPGAFIGGAGGGRSDRFAQPSYQRGIVPTALSTSNGTAMRVLPDIAADADPYTGLQTGAWTTTATSSAVWSNSTVGGTSLACPLVAGVQAAVQQARHGVPVGFADPMIYAAARSGVLHDVTDDPLGDGLPISVAVPLAKGKSGSTGPGLITFARDTSLRALPGYDDVTGVGSPSSAYLEWAATAR